MNRRARVLQIGTPWLESRADGWRVSALVNGTPVWFEGSGGEARAAAEAFASAFLLPAMVRGIPLRVDAPLDRIWLDHMAAQQRTFSRWWNYPVIPIEAEASVEETRPRANHTALFFTCGADSFYSLLHRDSGISALVMVHGYDVRLTDEPRSAMLRESVAAVAQATGKCALHVRTNLRNHDWFKQPHWQRTHGGGLAAVGHLLSAEYNQWLISSSSHLSYDFPYGSHWDTDPLWSSSSVRFVHVAAEVWRADKLAAIAQSELVREHLSVCYRQRGTVRNCGHCEKCLRTMLILQRHLPVAEFSTFAGEVDLPARIDRLHRIDGFRIPVYRRFIDIEPDAGMRQALERLIKRSSGWRGPIQDVRQLFRLWTNNKRVQLKRLFRRFSQE